MREIRLPFLTLKFKDFLAYTNEIQGHSINTVLTSYEHYYLYRRQSRG